MNEISNNIFLSGGKMADDRKTNNLLWFGNCLEEMKRIPNKSIDLIYCDLPYGTTQCKWDDIIPYNKMWIECKRVLKDYGTIVFHAQQPFTSALIMSNPKMFKYTWVWEKSKATGFLNSKIRPLVAHEDIVVFAKNKPPYNPQMTKGSAYNKGIRKQQTKDDVYGSFEQVEVKSGGLRYPRSVQYFKTAESEGKTWHKTQKPLDLCKYIINTYTQEGETVLDFTCGSDTTGIASFELGRNSISIENDLSIYKLAKKRREEKNIITVDTHEPLIIAQT
jgi:DNA modification methylase